MKKYSALVLITFFCFSCAFQSKSKQKQFDGWSLKHRTPIVKVLSRFEKSELSNEKIISDINQKYLGLIRFVKPKLDPYTGELLTRDKCLIENLPPRKIIEDENHYLMTVHLYSSNINSVGQCFSDKDLYKTSYNYLLCKESRKVFRIKYFYEDKFDWVNDQIIFCNKL